jgi:hypothetical protein
MGVAFASTIRLRTVLMHQPPANTWVIAVLLIETIGTLTALVGITAETLMTGSIALRVVATTATTGIGIPMDVTVVIGATGVARPLVAATPLITGAAVILVARLVAAALMIAGTMVPPMVITAGKHHHFLLNDHAGILIRLGLLERRLLQEQG